MSAPVGSSSSMTLSIMQELSLFATMDSREMATLAAVLRLSQIPAGTKLYEEGKAARGFLILADGTVTLTKRLARSNRELATLGPNSVLGHVPLIDGGANASTATAKTDLLLLACDRDVFERLAASQSAVGLKLMVPLVTAACRLARACDALVHGLDADPQATLLTLHTS